MTAQLTAKVRSLVTVLAFVASSGANAELGASGSVSVISTLQDPVNYGGCMARIDPGPGEIAGATTGSLLDCPLDDVFVSFDCLNFSGQTSKSSAQQMFQTAQLAYVAGEKVNVVVDDSVKLNGFCLVRRIDLLPKTIESTP